MLLPFMIPDVLEAGCDEAGRGCLCGPVACAAVILPPGFRCDELNDSKQLSERQREALRPIIEKNALAWAVAMIDPETIDKINILNASILGMHKALEQLQVSPGHILVDGNRFKPFRNIPHTTVVKGDAKYMSIAAASILAKTHRDSLLEALDARYPEYGWRQNKGYPTKSHKEAIIKFGFTPLHRRTFKYS